MGDGNSFPLVCAVVTASPVILAYKSIELCKCSGNVLIGYERIIKKNGLANI